MGVTVTLTDQDALDWLATRGASSPQRPAVFAATDAGRELEPAVAFAPAPIIPVTPGASAVELDADGLPWDGRINSAGRAIVADGRWKKKRGIDPDYITQVQNELRRAMTAPAFLPMIADVMTSTVVPPPSITTPVVPAVPVPPPTVASAVSPAPLADTTPATGSAGAATTASLSDIKPVVAATTGPISFPALMQTIIKGKFEQATVHAALASIGLESLPMLAQRPDLIPNFCATLGIGGAA